MKKRIKNVDVTTLFSCIILIVIIAVFIVACLLPSDVNAAGASIDPNPAPIERLDSVDSNISVVPNTKWGTNYADNCRLVYDKNTNIVMYNTNGNLQPMLGPNGYPCRLEGSQIVETQTNQFVLSTE